MRSSLDIALAHVAAHPNRKLFPIQAGAKEPPKIKNNLIDASNDPDQITTWHTKNPGCNWGLALKASNVVVIDVDTKTGKHGQATFDALDVEYGFPKTETVTTPSGGKHFYYEGEHVFALGTNGFGLDIDSPNYVLIAGCELSDPVTGLVQHYVAEGKSPTAIAPEWFGAFLVKRNLSNNNADAATPLVELDQDDNVERMIEWLKDGAPASVQGSNGDQQTLKVAMRLRDEGVSQEKANEIMAEHYNVWPTCEPEWSGDELETKVRNAYAYASINAPGEKTAQAEFAADPLPSNEKTPDPKSDALADKAREAKAQVAARQGQERKWSRAEIVNEWVWVADIKRFVWRDYPEVMWDKETFDDYFDYCKPQGVARLSKALFSTSKNTIRKLVTLAYLPGAPEFCGDADHRALNLYKPGDIVPAEGDTSLWDAHLEYLFPDETERGHVLNWCAWLLQNLPEKPKHALLVAGRTQGTGKSFITEVLSKILGDHNVQPVGEDELDGQFNEWALRAKLITIEELRTIDRGHVAKKLHPLITQDHIKVNDKNVKRISIKNCFGFFMMTNDDAAISLDNSDRRYLVVRTHATPREKSYYDTLYLKCLRDNDFLAAVAYQLQHRDLAGYSGQARAPDTHAKSEMIEAGLSDLEHWMNEHANEYPLNVRITTIDDVLLAIPKEFLSHVSRRRNVVAGILAYRFKGVKLGQHKVNGKPKSLWALNGTGAAKIEGVPLGAIYLDDIKRSDQVSERSAKEDFEE